MGWGGGSGVLRSRAYVTIVPMASGQNEADAPVRRTLSAHSGADFEAGLTQRPRGEEMPAMVAGGSVGTGVNAPQRQRGLIGMLTGVVDEEEVHESKKQKKEPWARLALFGTFRNAVLGVAVRNVRVTMAAQVVTQVHSFFDHLYLYRRRRHWSSPQVCRNS